MAGGGSSGGYQSQSYGGYQPQGQSYSPQAQTNSGGGGYNPQPMPGAPYAPGPPGWDMRLGAGGVPYMEAGMGRLTPEAPEWLKLQMGQYEDQPFATNPNQYGRWNWGTNLQGGGIPSPFGQYAQQFATYPPLNFPPPPQPPGGGQPPPGPGTPPPGGGQPPAPPSGPQDYSKLTEGQQFSLAHYLGWNDPFTQSLYGKFGGNPTQKINQYEAGGTNYDPQMSAWAQQYAMSQNQALPAATRAYNASLLAGSPFAQFLK